MYQENICPECGSRHHQDFVRCPSCHAFIIEDSPWHGEFNLLAIPLTLLFWWAADYLFGIMPVTREVFSDVISRAILAFAIYGLLILFFKWRLISKQKKAFTVIRKVCAEYGDSLDEQAITQARDEIDARNLGPYNSFIAFHRLRWLSSTAKVDKEDRQGMLESLRQHSESDWDSLETSFSFTQFLIWLLPSVGFLGTVWGMTTALQAFSTTVGSQSDLNFNAGLMDTARGLGTAFHTTLVGLAAVIPVLAYATSCRRRAQNLLEKLDKYFLRLASHVLFQQQELDQTPAEPADAPLTGEAPVLAPPVPAAPEPGDELNSATVEDVGQPILHELRVDDPDHEEESAPPPRPAAPSDDLPTAPIVPPAETESDTPADKPQPPAPKRDNVPPKGLHEE